MILARIIEDDDCAEHIRENPIFSRDFGSRRCPEVLRNRRRMKAGYSLGMDRIGNWVKKPRPRDWSIRRRNSASLTRNTVEGARKRARVMALEIARQSVGGTGKAIRTWAIARYYVDVRDVSSIILIAEITVASTAPTALSLLLLPLSRYLPSCSPYPRVRDIHTGFSHMHFHIGVRNKRIQFRLRTASRIFIRPA